MVRSTHSAMVRAMAIHGKFRICKLTGILLISDLFPYQDKQEIKTVRIVKRESERRQRDKDKTGGPLIGSNVFDHIAEFPDELNEYLSTTYRGEPRIGSYSEDDALMSDDELCLSPSVTNAANFIYGVTMG